LKLKFQINHSTRKEKKYKQIDRDIHKQIKE
jgi:hypothetical protein